MRTALVAALAIAPSLFAAESAKTAAATNGFSPERFQRLKSALKEMTDKQEFAGIQVMAARKGQLVLSESFGYRDVDAKKPMTADTIVRLYSMTKILTSTAAMILYEEGKFLMDDPVSKYIPEFANVKVLRKEGGGEGGVEDLKRPLTVLHLLTHTSGMVNSNAYSANRVFDTGSNLEEMSKRLAAVPLAHQPGDAWRYGQGLEPVARLVEIWSGKRYDQFVRERLFEPLGMKDTGYFVPKEKFDRVSKLYALNKDGVVELGRQDDPSREPNYFGGGSGVLTTTADYLKFLQMMLNGGSLGGKRILSRATVDFMMSNRVPLDVIPPNGPNNRSGHGFGIGGAVLVNPVKSQLLQVEGNFEWGGAAGTYFWIDRKNELIGVWMVQRPPFVPGPGKKFKVMLYSAME